MAFRDVHVTERPGEECVVYIDVDSMWGSGFNSAEILDELLDETDYTDSEPLYRFALSDAYLLTK